MKISQKAVGETKETTNWGWMFLMAFCIVLLQLLEDDQNVLEEETQRDIKKMEYVLCRIIFAVFLRATKADLVLYFMEGPSSRRISSQLLT